jgi:hypothetical protein
MITVTTTFHLRQIGALDGKKVRREWTLLKTRFNTVLREEYQRGNFGAALIEQLSIYPPERTAAPVWKHDRQRIAAIARMKAMGRAEIVNGRLKYRRSFDYQNGWLTELTVTDDGSDLRVYNVTEYGGYVGGNLVLYSGGIMTRSNVDPTPQVLNRATLQDWQQAFHRAQGWVTVAPIVQSELDTFIERIIRRFNLNVKTLAERGLLFVGTSTSVQTGL